ncbi:MAG: hypothetical protein WAU01_09700 [Saprospiraceae bacterium]
MRLILFIIWVQFLLFSSCKKDTESVDMSIKKESYKDSIFTNILKRTSGVVAADAALSIDLKNGLSLWLYGDSYIDNYDPLTKTVPCLFQVRNAGVLTSINDPNSNPITLLGNGSPKSYFALGTNPSFWYWPGTGYQRGDTCFVFLGRIKSTGTPGTFGFEEVDSQYVAKIKIPEMTKLSYTNLGSKKKISFTNGIVNSDGYYYVYGIRDNGFGRDLLVARYREDNPYTDWEYKGSTNWTKEIDGAVKIHSQFTSSFHMIKVAGKYVLITTELSVGCNQGKEIYSFISDRPEGPFVKKTTIWKVDDTKQGHFPIFYLAYAHPEYENGKNELLITYCINGYGACIASCQNNRLDPDIYRPRAIRVPYTLIGI